MNVLADEIYLKDDITLRNPNETLPVSCDCRYSARI